MFSFFRRRKPTPPAEQQHQTLQDDLAHLRQSLQAQGVPESVVEDQVQQLQAEVEAMARRQSQQQQQ